MCIRDSLEVLGESGVLHGDGERWDWIADSYPAIAVSLRSVADGNFVVVDRTGGRQQIIADVDYSTDAIDYTKLKVLERFDGRVAGAGTAQHGEVHVLRRVSGYKKIRYY